MKLKDLLNEEANPYAHGGNEYKSLEDAILNMVQNRLKIKGINIDKGIIKGNASKELTAATSELGELVKAENGIKSNVDMSGWADKSKLFAAVFAKAKG